ncbi:hypothetical protein NHX12_033145 [Muraenolepis orangiensis]|uniref:SH3 domain-containing protein n=1 Tax=Muraenolepis orangiensis TaxID=630683 RepID=A0A9Q0E1X4_9TELE|nr:hypothetical protein NHX12_033145 [Muraenolepis orangiensis]
MKKKFNITGREEAMYQAVVTVTTKARKYDLPATSGDHISIIRTNNCPKGKWLARDHGNSYGYIAVDHLELDIKEMMEMGKRTTHHNSTTQHLDPVEDGTTDSRHSNDYPLSTGSFTDDSEEWTGDEEDPLSPTQSGDVFSPQGHTQTHSMPEIGTTELSVVHQHSHSDISTEDLPSQARHEALQKLATFFHPPKPVVEEEPAASAQEEPRHAVADEETDSKPQSGATGASEGGMADMLILPPPDLYADTEPGPSSL